jgi:hypothetical protein
MSEESFEIELLREITNYDNQTRQRGLEKLQVIGTLALPLLQQVLQNAGEYEEIYLDENHLFFVVGALGFLEGPEVVKILQDILLAKYPLDRHEQRIAAHALHRINPNVAFQTLLDVLNQASPFKFSWTLTTCDAARILLELDDILALPILNDALNGQNCHARVGAAVGLAEKGNQQALDILIEISVETDMAKHEGGRNFIYKESLQPLVNAGDKRIVPTLLLFLSEPDNDSNKYLKEAATAALRKLGHNPDAQE